MYHHGFYRLEFLTEPGIMADAAERLLGQGNARSTENLAKKINFWSQFAFGGCLDGY